MFTSSTHARPSASMIASYDRKAKRRYARPPRRELSPTERALLGQPERVLIDHEYVAIISARLERLEALHARLLPLSQAGSIASTVTVLPLRYM